VTSSPPRKRGSRSAQQESAIPAFTGTTLLLRIQRKNGWRVHCKFAVSKKRGDDSTSNPRQPSCEYRT
jgi:hypothetical protein